jgi:effector-binding domain-containing protein
MRAPLLSLLLVTTVLTSAMAAEQAFPPTAPDTLEIKTLPAGVLLKSTGRGNYFDQSNNLFGPLFRYISRHDIAMTTPVEAKIDQAAMYFWVANSQRDKVAGNEGGVEVIEIPERRVASAGASGSYSQKKFEETRDRLLAWLEQNPDWRADGEPYAVYWHGPFTPWFAKRSEVHVPVRARR